VVGAKDERHRVDEEYMWTRFGLGLSRQRLGKV
jgi:hypothetical protein